MPQEPLTFSFLLFGVLGMLIGGCMWGTGESGGNALVHGFGLFFFALGCLMIVASAILCLRQRYKDRRRRRKLAKKGLQGLENAMAVAADEKETRDPENPPSVLATEQTPPFDLEHRRSNANDEVCARDPNNAATDLRQDVTSSCETETSTVERSDDVQSRDPDVTAVERNDDAASRDSNATVERSDDDVSHDSGISTPKLT